jgi:hypothetical protein
VQEVVRGGVVGDFEGGAVPVQRLAGPHGYVAQQDRLGDTAREPEVGRGGGAPLAGGDPFLVMADGARERRGGLPPEDFANILSKNKKAKEVFNKFSPSHKKEYIEWINEAKREETRNKRINTAIEWITEGKGRNWKYER